MKAVFENALVEYDGTGAPTGKVWVNGIRGTLVGAALNSVGSIPAIDGSTSTKVFVQRQMYGDALAPFMVGSGIVASTVSVQQDFVGVLGKIESGTGLWKAGA